MTPEAVRRETLLLASGRWAGPWEVLVRIGELDHGLLATEIVAMGEAALEELARQGCLRFVRGDPTLERPGQLATMSRSQVVAVIRDTGWRAATQSGDTWFTLTPKGERALERELGVSVRTRRTRELGKVVAGFATAVRSLFGGRRGSTPAGRVASARARRHPEDLGRSLRPELNQVDSRWLDLDPGFDDDAGLASAPVPRRPPDRSGSGAAAVIPEPDYRFEIETHRVM